MTASEKRKAQREARKAAGLCSKCGLIPPAAGFVSCHGCMEVMREAQKRTFANRAAKGLCIRCAVSKPVAGKTLCKTCRTLKTLEDNAAQLKRYHAKRAAGLCTRCGSPSEKSTCEACRPDTAVHARKYYWTRREQGLCPSCGRKPEAGKVLCIVCSMNREAQRKKVAA